MPEDAPRVQSGCNLHLSPIKPLGRQFEPGQAHQQIRMWIEN